MIDESILVPTDGTAVGELGATFATFLTERFGGNVHRFAVTADDVAGAIVREFWQFNNSVVCMATHEHRHSELLVPSVAAEVVRRLHEPTILVGGGVDFALVGKGDRVVVGVGTEGSELAVASAAQWAARLDVMLEVVTVVEPVPEPLPGHQAHRHHGPDDPGAYLNEIAVDDSLVDLDVRRTVVEDPIGVAQGLQAHLRDHPAVLLAVGSRHRERHHLLVLGDDTADIVWHSPTGVLVVPLA
jgi:nucleotide-binding universal stress UspA family protein